jgi:hypothetical protein
MKYEIHIGESIDLETNDKNPYRVMIITPDQLALIEVFAHIRKDSQLNNIYKLNDVEFKITPFIEVSDD